MILKRAGVRSMGNLQFVKLERRGVLGVSGPDAREFLQNLITNDMAQVAPDRAIYAALLTPQGKFLHDFIVLERPEDGFLLDCEADRLMDLGKRLAAYRLRATVEIADLRDDLSLWAVVGPGSAAAVGLAEVPGLAGPFVGGRACVDPREAGLGVRAMLPRDNAEESLLAAGIHAADEEAYETLRLSLGVPDGSRDVDVEKATLAEAGFEALHGIDFTKGCYVGQEVTTRMKHRGTARKRLVPILIDGTSPPPGTPVMAGGKEVGEIRSSMGGLGLALLRLDRIDADVRAGLKAGDARLTLRNTDPDPRT